MKHLFIVFLLCICLLGCDISQKPNTFILEDKTIKMMVIDIQYFKTRGRCYAVLFYATGAGTNLSLTWVPCDENFEREARNEMHSF